MQSSTKTSKPIIAFFGATGGCCAAVLARSLNAGYTCTALARTPSKLTSILLSKDVSQSIISTELHITEGDVRDVEAVKKVLSLDNKPVGIIISGIGVITMKKVTICADATRTILSALAGMNMAQKPLMLGFSSTGISAGPRDVPLLMYLPYKYLLAGPHHDKAVMEEVLLASSDIRGAVIVRPTLLTDGAARGKGGLRVGNEQKPAVGYKVSREDVGQWIFENIVQDENRDKWLGEKVSMTH